MSKLRIFSVSMMVFAIMAVGVSAETEEGDKSTGLTEDQIGSVIDMLVAFEVEEGVIETVRAALEGKDVEIVNEDEKEDDEEENNSKKTKGVSELPEAASDRAKQVHACLRITRVLRNGDFGTEVEELQAYLQENGFFEYPEITGYFGSITEAAVQEYQAANGIVYSGSPDESGYGLVGPKTRAKIEHSTCISGNVDSIDDAEEQSVDDDQDGDGDDDQDSDGDDDQDGDGDDDQDGDGN